MVLDNSTYEHSVIHDKDMIQTIALTISQFKSLTLFLKVNTLIHHSSKILQLILICGSHHTK